MRVPDQIAAIRTLADMYGWFAAQKHAHEVGDTLAQVLKEIDGRTRGLPTGA